MSGSTEKFVYMIRGISSAHVVYVGVSHNPKKRGQAHKHDSCGDQSLSGWLKRHAGDWEIVSLEKTSDWREREKWWIYYFRKCGENLFNHHHNCRPIPEITA